MPVGYENDAPKPGRGIRRLTRFAQIRKLYRSRMKRDFAPCELKPLSAMRRLWKRNAYDCYGLFDGEELLGYAFFVRVGKDRLLDYLAVAEGCRGRGCGSAFLNGLAGYLADADCVACEVEDPDKAADGEERTLRERRLRFYLRGGYLDTGLTVELFGVDYRILEASTASSPHTAEAAWEAYTGIYRSILPERVFRRLFCSQS